LVEGGPEGKSWESELRANQNSELRFAEAAVASAKSVRKREKRSVRLAELYKMWGGGEKKKTKTT